MIFLLFSLLLQLPTAMPDRSALPNPAISHPVPKQVQKDYNKLWNRFLSGKEDSKVSAEFEKLLKKDPELVAALLVQSYLDFYGGRQNDAERRLDKVLAKSPSDPIALPYLAELSYVRGDFVKATELYGRLRQTRLLEPSEEGKRQRSLLLAMERLLGNAKTALSENRLTDAERFYNRALSLAPREGTLDDQLASALRWNRPGEGDPQISLRSDTDAAAPVATDETGVPLGDLRRWGSQLEHFREIRASDALTREQLAGLLAGYFPELSRFGKRQEILVDVQGSWAESAIQTVVSAGLLDSMANHTFQPARTVTRGEFALAIARLARILGVTPATAPPIGPSDVVLGSTLYLELQPVLGYSLMTLDNAGNFNVGASLSGEEAVNTAEKLLRLLQKNTG
jgi:tetratricopeptide (TPR) repeat protein